MVGSDGKRKGHDLKEMWEKTPPVRRTKRKLNIDLGRR